MRLIHKINGERAKVGDAVISFRGNSGIISYFTPPHKPGSSGHVSVTTTNQDFTSYNYVSVWGLEWIEREDRR